MRRSGRHADPVDADARVRWISAAVAAPFICLSFGLPLSAGAADKPPSAPATAASKPGADKSKPPAIGAPVDINSASESTLATLEGITEGRARAIVTNRPYARTEDLVGRKVLPRGVFEKIRSQLVAAKPAEKSK